MRVRDIAVPAPVVEAGTPVPDALRLLISSGLPGLVALVGDRHVVVPGSQVLRVALPRYVIDDPSLARVLDEASADALRDTLSELTVADLVRALDEPAHPDSWVRADATLVEAAAVMSAAHVPLVAVLDGDRYLGVVTVNGIVDRLVG